MQVGVVCYWVVNGPMLIDYSGKIVKEVRSSCDQESQSQILAQFRQSWPNSGTIKTVKDRFWHN